MHNGLHVQVHQYFVLLCARWRPCPPCCLMYLSSCVRLESDVHVLHQRQRFSWNLCTQGQDLYNYLHWQFVYLPRAALQNLLHHC